MRTDLLLGIEHRDEFSDALFRMIFGRKPSYKRDKTFLIRYLNTIGKTREELLELHLKSGVTKEQLAAIGLVRGLYECFTRLLFANRKPELAWALILPAMIDGKKFEYCKNRVGRVERRKVRELETGNEFRIDYSLPEIFRLCEADRDAAVHPDFYLALSAEVHPTAELLFEFVQKQGFLLHRTPDTLFTIHMAGYVLFLIWREICVFPLLSKRDSRDARFALDEIREAMLVIIDRLRPVVLEGVADPFKDLFLGIAASVADPYDDRYWRNIADA